MSETGDLLSTLPPDLTDTEVAANLARHYGLAGPLKRLTSERDLNLRLDGSARRFVVKVANRAEPRAVTDFQTAALLHLEGKGLPVPQVVRTVAGATGVETPAGLLRVLTYLEGMPLHMAPRTAAQRAGMGAMAARISLGLQGFAHPGADHVLQWDVRQASALRPLLPHVPGDLRGLCAATLDHFDAQVFPRLADCRWQVVHNDLNPHNVLVDEADPDRISGVLDFGDMVRTALVCDLGVAASYQVDSGKPLESLVEFTAAYHRVLPLTPLELSLVPDLTAARMLTTICITSWRAAKYPGNASYILRNFPGAKAGLLALSALPRDRVSKALTRACPME
ncbi:MAG: aminotransferase [Pseudorhodobacter sp.]|nr:MAG: aminotransferase [Pseudorhodobacter sp.]